MKEKIQFETGVLMGSKRHGIERLRMFFLASGVDLTRMAEEENKKNIRLSFYFDRKEEAERMRSRLKAIPLFGGKVFSRTHQRSDWSSRWKKDWEPFSLTKRFYVIPLWQTDRRISRGKVAIFLETTSAFGTGLHETTRFTAGLIEGLSGEFRSFLDVGTGSGILTIVALKCGARRAAAFDIDGEAVKVAKDNLKANGLSCKVIRADVKSFQCSKGFDLVAANLVSMDLIEFRDRIVACVRPGGHLVVSGISLKNLPRVTKAFARIGLRLQETVKGREWAALLYKRGGK